jgi:hypothetical protein
VRVLLTRVERKMIQQKDGVSEAGNSQDARPNKTSKTILACLIGLVLAGYLLFTA